MVQTPEQRAISAAKYYQSRRESCVENQRQYAKDHYDEIMAKRKVMWTCPDCGKTVQYHSSKRHKDKACRKKDA